MVTDHRPPADRLRQSPDDVFVALATARVGNITRRLLTEMARSVAEAECGFDAGERAVIVRLCKLRGFDPASFDLIPGDGKQPRKSADH